ncbi:U4/U6.U5 tri-snRNP-associated protein 1 [Syngnathoides biaculeatus]|uniref:U4/U6.U5 tri-snRNP-associated protein 1 n=1 Tax=Syngnathoides biaculeatus TaxID=300417 RepID=UPI002ADD9D13|nr:U4/U6.U5 tri-snRNP-associated protein 1 [Syngnathoides biaculeatus]XP_061684948.1 U4/U6.U5 tri-snRNP-associated protein 1 [Syngnathoides biaculeatus]
MGSSKKHKEKSRDREAEERRREHKKHRRKERDRDASNRDGTREKDRRKRSASRDRSGRESRSKGDRSGGEPRVKKEKTEKGYEEGSTEVQAQSASGDASLSIEETNKLRAKLGLKPLEMNDNKKELGTKEEPLVAETINPALIQKQKDIKEKLAAMKEKRLLNQKLGKVKTLAEDDWLEDTAAWVEKNRKAAKEKEMAEKRAKLLEEMDQEFGVSSLVEEEFGQGRPNSAYTARDLKGLKVQHKVDSFNEGQTVILTLQDKGVLEEEEDVLENVGLVDKEKADKNVELKKKQPDYKPYEEEESVDDMVTFKSRSVLSKYDEEIDGEKKKSFRLKTGGVADGERERELQAMRETLRSQSHSLVMPSLTIASEYYSPQEMVAFKKTKRRVKKIRKKEKTTVADFLLLDDSRKTDFGSRTRGRGRKGEYEDDEGTDGGRWPHEPVTTAVTQMSDDVRTAEMDISEDEDFMAPEPAVLEEDEAEQELQKQLEKQRKLRQKQLLGDAGEKIAERVKRLTRDVAEDPSEKRNNIVFNATSEFCRTLGDIPTYGLSGNREDQEDMMDFEQDDEKEGAGDSNSDAEDNIGWSSVNLDEEQKHPDFATASATILDEEPIVNSGLAAALHLCKNKGLLETEVQKVARVKATKGALPNDNYCIEDKMGFDDKYSRREEYRGFTQDFKDKDGYKPDVKIEYVDESGRKLTPKEAFRQLSHRFHGKGSGKMKTERRMKKLEEEALLKKMSSSDTPLGTVALLQEKQKSQKTPYIVLSGSGKSMNANTITK